MSADRHLVRPGELAAALAVVALGGVGVLVASLEAADRVTVNAQMGWLTMGIIAMAVATAAQVALFAVSRRRIGLSRRDAVTALAARLPDTVAIDLAGPSVSAARMSWYHRPDCVLMTGKVPERKRHNPGRRTACPSCRPDGDRP